MKKLQLPLLFLFVLLSCLQPALSGGKIIPAPNDMPLLDEYIPSGDNPVIDKDISNSDFYDDKPLIDMNVPAVDIPLSEGNLPTTKLLMNNSHLGKDFYVTLHPVWQQYDTEERIFVYSFKDTYVTIETPGGGSRITKAVKAYQATIFTSKKSEIMQLWDPSHSESVTDFGLHVYSDDPIGVYVYTSSVSYAGEGYQAIPVEVWGKEYYNVSYYDFIYSGNSGHYAGGFVVVASEDKTKITITLKGVGSGKTKKGNTFGQTLTATLNAGQTYLVCGEADKSGIFDLTGTMVSSDKPIGVVSYHAFSCITSQTVNFGNYFDEMLLPLHLWGKTYVTTRFPRSGKKGDLGDYFRTISSSDNTTWHLDYYDEVSSKKLGQLGTTLKKPGDFFEYFQGAESGVASVKGVSVWTANKPFMVMQYAYSHQWDDDINWQPVMIQLTSLEQYISPIIFYAPEATTSQLTLFAIGEPADKEFKMLKTIKINGEFVYKKNTQILVNNIPGTSIFWARIDLNPGVYVLEGETKMAGYITRCRPSSVGWYIGMGTNKLDEYDVKPPVLKSSSPSCGKYSFTATELQTGKPTDSPRQIDQGISKIFLLEEDSYNYKLELDNPEKFKPQNMVSTQAFKLRLIDSSKKGFGKFVVLDRAGNYVTDSVYYEPDNFSASSEALNLGKCKAGTPKTACVTIKNNMGVFIDLNFGLLSGKFQIKNEGIETVELIPGDSIDIVLEYTAGPGTYDKPVIDTLFIQSECSMKYVPLTALGIAPQVQSPGWDFKTVDVNKSVCIEEQNSGKGLEISNPGSDTLIVYTIDNISSPFIVKNPAPAFPFSVLPGEKVNFSTLAFMPADTGDFSDNITIRTNAVKGDSVITLKGRGYKKDTTGVAETATADGNFISIQPNPASGRDVNIDYYIARQGEAMISICDIKGTVIREFDEGFREKGWFRIVCPARGLSAGSYYVILRSGDSQCSQKMVITK